MPADEFLEWSELFRIQGEEHKAARKKSEQEAKSKRGGGGKGRRGR